MNIGARVNYKTLATTVTSVASTATLTPNILLGDVFLVTAQAVGLTVANPTGTAIDGQKMIIRIKDNGGAQTIAWGTAYRASTDLTLPTTTIAGKTLYCGFMWNAADSEWDLIAKLNNF